MRKWITGLFSAQGGPKPITEAITDNDPDDEEIQKVLLVQRLCQIAEMSTEARDGSGSEDDAYETERFENQLKRALATANEMTDEFCLSSAMHFISKAMATAGQFDRAAKAIEFIEVDFIKEKAVEHLKAEKRKAIDKL